MTAISSSTEAASSALIIKLSARPDFASVTALPRGAERKSAAWDAITQTATESQKPLIEVAKQLEASGAISGWESLQSPNALIVTPAAGKSQAVMDAFRGAKGVDSIFDNTNGRQMFPTTPGLAPGTPTGPFWGLDTTGRPRPTVAPAEQPYGLKLVGAPEAWEQGADGRGMVFGSIDTGADATHEALAGNYRGRNADGTLSNDYNWIDFNGRPSAAPKDYDSHGTHTVGTAVGKGTGVAPGATWIAAHGLTGSVDAAMKALQWMQAPTKQDGTSPDPSKAPDVVGMSWWMGTTSGTLFKETMQNLHAAGIELVKSAGNKGPGDATITSPGQYPEVIATAAVDDRSKIANFSSRGPAPYPAGSTTPKPDYAAPGVDVVSSIPGNKYGKMSGTSMAQPHMSGVILDVLSKYPQLTSEQLRTVLTAGVTDAGKPGFDAEYGAGIVNLPKTLAAAAELLGQAPKQTRARRAA